MNAKKAENIQKMTHFIQARYRGLLLQFDYNRLEERSSMKANGIEIGYQVRGTGEPLILIMGLGAGGELWEEHVKAYEKAFSCILVDNRGAGGSDKPEGPYTTRMMADDIAALMQVLGIKKAGIAGLSMGGAIAQCLAIHHPEKVRSLVIACSWARCDAYLKRVIEHLQSARRFLPPVDFARMLQLLIFTPEYHRTNLENQ